jgi:hypothetical protein
MVEVESLEKLLAHCGRHGQRLWRGRGCCELGGGWAMGCQHIPLQTLRYCKWRCVEGTSISKLAIRDSLLASWNLTAIHAIAHASDLPLHWHRGDFNWNRRSSRHCKDRPL